MSRVAIAADHAGFELKENVIDFLKEKEILAHDFGCFSTESVDYPDVVHPLCKSISYGHEELGILICGSGNGVCMTANKYPSIRAALCWSVELASLARKHNNANILCIPARFIESKMALEMIAVFLTTDFEGGRHLNRVNKIERSE